VPDEGRPDEGRPDEGRPDDRLRVSSGSPWEPVIGFSRAVRVGDRVLVAGTAPVWPDGSCPADPAEQARRCLEIITAALADAGATVADVVRTRIYLTDPNDVRAVGEVHGRLFAGARPAATIVAVAALADPRWKVEIEAEAVVSEAVVSEAVVGGSGDAG
jgi:enamine deaminase RidA (YjgF/YER057c/UK114 family)